MPRSAHSAGQRLLCTALLSCSLVVEHVVRGAKEEVPCLIGNPGELRLTLNASSESLCCAAAQVYFARRPGGFCPETQSAQPLPFEVHCAVDVEMHGSYVPGLATAQAAEQLLCSLAECPTAASAVLAQAVSTPAAANSPGKTVQPQHTTMMLSAPQCSKPSTKTQLTATVRVLIVVFVVLLAVAIVSVFHFAVTPYWIRTHSVPCAAGASHLSVLTSSGSNLANDVYDVTFDLEVEHTAETGGSSSSTKPVHSTTVSEAAPVPDPMFPLARRPSPPPTPPSVEPPPWPAPPHAAAGRCLWRAGAAEQT